MSLPLDVTDTAALKRALADADFVVNALVPRFNTGIMRACLETGTGYLDMAGDNDMDDEIALDEQFRKAGLTALVFFGIDPGASDVFARCLYDQFDTVESLTVLDGDNATVDGFEIVASFSPATMIEEVAASPPGFVDGVLTRARVDVGRQLVRVRLPGAGRAPAGLEHRPRGVGPDAAVPRR